MDNERIQEISKTVRITEEYSRLSQRFVRIDANKRTVIEGLLRSAAFMRVTLEDLEEIINENGTVETYQNGQYQTGLKQSAAVQSYNQIVKNYSTVIKTLTSLVPLEEREPSLSPLDRWRMEHQEPEETPEERLERCSREWEESVQKWHEDHPDEVYAD